MSDKLNFSPASFSRLQSFSLLSLEGPDAVAFMQAQSMNDVTALADGQWHWNGQLNPKGRLIALFALLRVRADLLYLLLPDFPAEKLAEHLQRFVFRSKVKLVVKTDTILAAELDPGFASNLSRDATVGDLTSGFALDFSSDTIARRLWLIPKALASAIVNDIGADDRWRDWDILHGIPRLTESQSERWTPHMLSLDRLKAFSLKKGCYPGQEIVARTHYLGQSKRQTGLIKGNALELLEPIFRATEKVGEFICLTSTADAGLAILHSVLAADALSTGEREVKYELPLTGLQRPV